MEPRKLPPIGSPPPSSATPSSVPPPDTTSPLKSLLATPVRDLDGSPLPSLLGSASEGGLHHKSGVGGGGGGRLQPLPTAVQDKARRSSMDAEDRREQASAAIESVTDVAKDTAKTKAKEVVSDTKAKVQTGDMDRLEAVLPSAPTPEPEAVAVASAVSGVVDRVDDDDGASVGSSSSDSSSSSSSDGEGDDPEKAERKKLKKEKKAVKKAMKKAKKAAKKAEKAAKDKSFGGSRASAASEGPVVEVKEPEDIGDLGAPLTPTPESGAAAAKAKAGKKLEQKHSFAVMAAQFATTMRSFWPKPYSRLPVGGFPKLGTKKDVKVLTGIRDDKAIRVWTVTWNVHAKKPPKDLSELVPRNQYHIMVFGTQECQNSIVKSIFVTRKDKWEKELDEAVGKDYIKLTSCTLQAIHQIVFVHKMVMPIISDIQSAVVACGMSNTLGNKGGVGISFNVGKTSMLFVTCHLAAHQDNVEMRNDDLSRIEKELALTPTDTSMEAVSVFDRFDRVFLLGDLNYRINGTRGMVDSLLSAGMHEVLVFNDQLGIERGKGLLNGFEEGPLNFRPTYKYDKGTHTYDSSKKQRIPSWTDRILWRPPNKSVKLLAYDDISSIRTSDHTPVYAAFEVMLRGGERRDAVGARDLTIAERAWIRMSMLIMRKDQVVKEIARNRRLSAAGILPGMEVVDESEAVSGGGGGAGGGGAGGGGAGGGGGEGAKRESRDSTAKPAAVAKPIVPPPVGRRLMPTLSAAMLPLELAGGKVNLHSVYRNAFVMSTERHIKANRDRIAEVRPRKTEVARAKVGSTSSQVCVIQ